MNITLKRAVLLGAGMFLLAGSAAPFVQANRFGNRVKAALETSLRRKVHIGAVHLDLFTGPGFSVKKVLIEEDPAIGVEPIASVETLSARVSLSSLWTGQLKFSSLTLDEPSVNLSRDGEGPWNLLQILLDTQPQSGPSQNGSSGQAEAPDVPVIRVRSGRINIKIGDKKLPVYLANADVDISPLRGDPTSFDLSFEGEPARTDTRAQTFGKIRGQGRWTASHASKEGELRLSLELAKSNVGEVTRLFKGRDYGLHGLVASRATVAGPLSALVVKGELQMSDVHRWDAMPGAKGGEWRLKYEGTANWHGQTFTIEAGDTQNPGVPIGARLEASNLLRSPRWNALVLFNEVPAAGTIEVLRHMGVPATSDILVEGAMSGTLTHSSESGLTGDVTIQNASLRASGDDEPLTVETADLKVQGRRVILLPATVQISATQVAHVEGEFGDETTLSIRGRAIEIAAMQTKARRLLSSEAIPWVETLKGGRWNGAMQYVRTADGQGRWVSAFELRDTQATVPGLADPLRIRAALVELDGDQLTIRRMKGTLGDIVFQGDYRYEPESERPHSFKLETAACDLVELERLLMPTLKRSQSFLARTLNFGSAKLPDWLAHRQAAGTVRIARLAGPEFEIVNFNSKLVWTGAQIRLDNAQGRLEGAEIAGTVAVDASSSEPRYRLRGRIAGLPWHGGKLDVDGKLQMAGFGAALLGSLKSDGTFQARSVDLLEDNPVKVVTGAYDFSYGLRGPQLALRSVEASLSGDRYLGEGVAEAGMLQMDLTSGSRVLHVAGPLKPLKLDVVAKN